jgi:hypothetical protein
MARRILVLTVTAIVLALGAGPALACGGLLSPNGSVNLIKTTTLAAYYKGIEHYLTSFRFVGGGGAKFGSIVPLPGIPSKVEKGGWTLNRLIREVAPPQREFFATALSADSAGGRAQVILETRIDALDITVLKGGGDEVARWAEENGFELSPDAPEVLDFYAERSPIFLAARFDTKAAADQGLAEGDGTPIHVTIPTPSPWVPLRILGLGKKAQETIQADVFLLTERTPSMLPAPVGVSVGDLWPRTRGLTLQRSEQANQQLMNDIRSDKDMTWVPRHMWLSYITVDAQASDLSYDLALDASGQARPSFVAAGLSDQIARVREAISPNDGLVGVTQTTPWLGFMGIGAGVGAAGALVIRRIAA